MHVITGKGCDRYIDLGFPEYRQGVEYDGREHHGRPEDRMHDHARRAALRDMGWNVLVCTQAGVLIDPGVFLRQLLGRLSERGWDPGRTRMAVIRRNIDRIEALRKRERQNRARGDLV
ncbi:hypothetical protein HDA32_005493 [Spinactinospora alkalitolerans]|uniref:DUF559 domain-containing protein n=1 Tax=Spinactinospora alkalitolerans TaxID=687207 RepID=A0A852U674_9ACTN|nr:DUF559 domain-containing protein [Spinactinospora alkalitolerans]NYE50373.1 hypothetical protein [Spinactinospora alkalitolerans]